MDRTTYMAQYKAAIKRRPPRERHNGKVSCCVECWRKYRREWMARARREGAGIEA